MPLARPSHPPSPAQPARHAAAHTNAVNNTIFTSTEYKILPDNFAFGEYDIFYYIILSAQHTHTVKDSSIA